MHSPSGTGEGEETWKGIAVPLAGRDFGPDDLCSLPHSPCCLPGCSELLSPLAGSGFIPFFPCEV